jgi:two-component system sensor histidine kinase AlgZ
VDSGSKLTKQPATRSSSRSPSRSSPSGSSIADEPSISASQFLIPELCNATALSLLVLVGQLLALVLLFAGGPFDWTRLALTSLFVQWVGLFSAGMICASRPLLARFSVVAGSVVAYGIVLLVTLAVALVAQTVLSPNMGIQWAQVGGQLVIAAIIAGLALRYFYVQVQLREQEQSELQSRIQALQSRIRPHFLFNSMNIIASLIATQPETAETVVEDLSELFRASLNDAGNQVPLADELDLCQRYVRIESLRLGERLQTQWDIDPLIQSVKIPLLTLQPLLENAIYHGIQPIPEGGTINIHLRLDKAQVQVRIDNPLPPETASGVGESQGNRMALTNIRSRLQVLYGAQAGLTNSIEEGRFVTRLYYPLAASDSAATLA